VLSDHEDVRAIGTVRTKRRLNLDLPHDRDSAAQSDSQFRLELL
jgi:hypothetical protein